jgi:protein dithiol:quinone oxidoreductase
MNRYATVPWPWLGFLVLLALLAQELVLKVASGPSDLTLVAWRIATMTLGVASFALLVMPGWRPAMLLGGAACAAAMGFALYAQYGLGLEPCPLCIFQRVAVIACGAVFLLGAIHNPGRIGATIYSLLIVVCAGAGAVVSGRHVWLQSLPPDKVPACGAGLSYMLETLPFSEVLSTVLKGSGECSSIDWRFLDLTMPAWVLVFFLSVIVAAVVLSRRG